MVLCGKNITNLSNKFNKKRNLGLIRKTNQCFNISDNNNCAQKGITSFKSLHYTQDINKFYEKFDIYDETVGTGKYSGNQFSISSDGKKYIVDGTFISSNNYGSKSYPINLAFSGSRVKLNKKSSFYEKGFLFCEYFPQPLQFVGIYEDNKDAELPEYLSTVKQAKYIILDNDELSYFTINFDNTDSKPRNIKFVKSIVKPK